MSNKEDLSLFKWNLPKSTPSLFVFMPFSSQSSNNVVIILFCCFQTTFLTLSSLISTALWGSCYFQLLKECEANGFFFKIT
jgi:hypothetical protein